MAKLLYIGTHGTDDPTAATFPFLMAKGAVDGGHETGLTLMGEAAPLIKTHIAEQVHGVGIPPLKELVDFLVSHEIPITVWGLCASARGVTEEDLAGKNARFGTPVDAANAHAEYDRVVTFWTFQSGWPDVHLSLLPLTPVANTVPEIPQENLRAPIHSGPFFAGGPTCTVSACAASYTLTEVTFDLNWAEYRFMIPLVGQP